MPTLPVPGRSRMLALFLDVDKVKVPALSILMSPAEGLEVERDKEDAIRSILSAAASWISAVVLVALDDNCKVDAPALINIPVVLCATIPLPTKLWVAAICRS